MNGMCNLSAYIICYICMCMSILQSRHKSVIWSQMLTIYFFPLFTTVSDDVANFNICYFDMRK